MAIEKVLLCAIGPLLSDYRFWCSSQDMRISSKFLVSHYDLVKHDAHLRFGPAELSPRQAVFHPNDKMTGEAGLITGAENDDRGTPFQTFKLP